MKGWPLRATRVASLIVVVALTVYLFSIREQATKLAAYGYPGILILQVLANATLILPMPGLAITFAAGAVFNPLGVGVAAGIGAALGETTGYLAGFSGQGVLESAPLYQRLEDLTRRYGGWVILVLAAIPNPLFDLAGAAAGALRMPYTKFLLWSFVGKTFKMLVIAYAGASSAAWILDLFSPSP